jgi:hypothetical protein
LIVFMGIFVLTINVKALSVKPSGLTSIAPGGTKNINIIIEGASSTTMVSGVDGTLVYDSNVLTFNSATKVTSWSELNGLSSSSLTFAVGDLSFNNLISTTPVTLYTLSFTAKSTAAVGNTTISITNPSCTDDTGSSISGVTGGSITVRIQSTVNTLSGLSISGGTISFNASTTSYDVTIDSASATISATATDSAATVTGTGTKTLNYGANTFNIVVTSEGGTTKTYTINVTRPGGDSSTSDSTTTNPKTGISYTYIIIVFLITLGTGSYLLIKKPYHGK